MEEPRRALIIDDEQDICYLLGKMLSTRNILAESAFSLEEGTTKLHSILPALLFLDIHLPDGSGLDHLQSFRAAFPKTFIVVMSAYDSFAERNAAIDKAADFFLPKPFQREMIDELNNTSFLKT